MASATTSSTTGAGAYSALLRRSKLATFNPRIDQVYTAPSSSRAHGNNYGLKRPLPTKSTRAAPFVRVLELETTDGRTGYRKATRETKFTRQWAEMGVGIQPTVLGDRAAEPTPAPPIEPQPVPNFFLMQPRAFDQFLLDLGRRRSEFRAFVAEEENKRSVSLGQPATADPETYDLYAHAQREPVELVRLVERFLRLPKEVDPRFPDAEPSKRDPALAEPMPLVHPTLALQYSTPTPLESSLAPPVEGRILGPVNDAASRNGHIGAMYDRKNKVYAQVLSQISMIPANAAGNTQPTTWFPDVAGERSNVPGRASFRIQPTINPTTYAARASLERAGFYASIDFRPPTEEHGSALLEHSRIETHPLFGGAGSRRRRQGDGPDPIAQLRARRQGQGQQGQGSQGQRGGSRRGQANERSRELIGKLQSMMNNGNGGGSAQ
ncbi:hypothetical protein AAT19DRAFT_15602 [Rhodotorula toruloides]|uniref:Uncharacterized protein n=1 Tax=Rhodotorula toruloides TaxID=5286 RepID=A0A2T0A7Q7_RHOTO|nr:hypothetical protein AAT19DRAFT_15602 [Rhodotorula toruloides]